MPEAMFTRIYIAIWFYYELMLYNKGYGITVTS